MASLKKLRIHLFLAFNILMKFEYNYSDNMLRGIWKFKSFPSRLFPFFPSTKSNNIVFIIKVGKDR